MTYPQSYLAPVEPGWGDLPVVFKTELEADVRHSHTVATQVQVLRADGSLGGTIWDVTDGSVVLDSTAASRAHVDVTIAGEEWAPTSKDSLLTPFGNEIKVARGVVVEGSHVELVRLGIFGIASASPSDSGEAITTTVSGIDRSWKFIDAPFEAPYTVAAGTLAETAILNVLHLAWADFPYRFVSTNDPLPALFAEEASSTWDFAQGVATAVGCELYFSANGRLILEPTPTGGGEAVDRFDEGEDGILLNIARQWDRDRVYNRVIVTGESTDVSGTPPRAVATDGNWASPTFYDGPFGHKPLWWGSEFITTTAQAQIAANALLQRSLGAPDSLSFETLVNPSRRPGDLVRVRRERLGVDQDHLVDQITIPLGPEGGMSSQTRIATALELPA